MQQTNDAIVEVDRETADPARTADTADDRRYGSDTLLIVAAAVLASALFVWLIVRPPFPLGAQSIPDDRLSITVQSGSAGAEDSEAGPLWWITSAPALIGLANNTAEPVVVEVSMRLSNGPCAVSRDADFAGQLYELAVGDSADVSSGPIELDGYDRLALPLALAGEPCAPTSADPRSLVAAVSNLAVWEVEQ